MVEINDVTNKIVNSTYYPSEAGGVLFDQQENKLYVTTNLDGNVVAINVQSGLVSYTYSGFMGLAFTNGSNLYFFGRGSGDNPYNLTIVDANSHQTLGIIKGIGYGPYGQVLGPVLFDPVNGRGYLTIESVGADGGGHDWSLWIVNTTSNSLVVSGLDLGTIGLQLAPSMVAFNPSSGDVYYSDGADYEPSGMCCGSSTPGDNLTIVHGTQVDGKVQLATSPNCAVVQNLANYTYTYDSCAGVVQSTLGALSYNNGQLYVINGSVYPRGYNENLNDSPPNTPSNDILSVSLNSNSMKVTRLSFDPINLFSDPSNGYLYVTASNGSMYVLSFSS